MSGRLAVVGAGSWGTAFAAVLAGAGQDVRLVARDDDVAAAIAAAGRNPRYVPDADLAGVEVVGLGPRALAEVETIVLAVPSRAVAQVCADLAPDLPTGAGVVSLSKGLDPATGDRLSLAIARELGPIPLAVVTGPSHAEEVAVGRPTAVVAGGDDGLARALQEFTAGSHLRIYRNDDLIGLEIAAAAKNVIALAAGMADGYGTGDNAKAALVTRGLAEMTRLGVALGARESTFRGLAGMGDLIATCASPLSRNRRAGELIATGTPAGEVEDALGQVVEGLVTVDNLLVTARGVAVELPISAGVRAVVRGEITVAEALTELMARAPTAE